MLQIFWETKERLAVKEIIVRRLKEIEKQIFHDLRLACLASSPCQSFRRSTGRQATYDCAKIIFTDSAKIKLLNKSYRKIDKATDVLSFAELDTQDKLLKEDKTLGEIYINYDWIKNHGTRNIKQGTLEKITRLFIHGYLHLLGYNHEKDQGEMEKLENRLRKLHFIGI
ncbi:MAG: rRNA maturation RNase YbeY [Candidatus Moranbacteria bacterium]|nr:rRNA maturation RNase YbeY [Candidatus Moranbacteria bacterium]